MNDRAKTLLQGILENALWDALKLLLEVVLGVLLSAAIGGAASKLLASRFDALRPYTSFIALLLVGLALLVFVRLYQRFRRNVPRFPPISVDYSIVQKEIRLDMSSRNTGVYRRTLTIRALRDHVDRFYDKYSWSGSGTLAPYTNIPGHKIVLPNRKNVWQPYEIILDRSLRKGEQIDIEASWDITDASSMTPFVSTVVEEPTESLTFVVSLPAAYAGKQAIVEISSGLGARKPLRNEVRVFDRKGALTWHIPDPRLLFTYEVNWIWQ